MKKAIKLLSLAMLFALPLAACGNNDNGGGSGSGDSGGGGSGGGGGGSGGGGGGSSLTAKGEATRIAAEMYGIDEDEVTFADYEDEEAEGEVYKYESSKLSFYMTGYWDDSMSYDEMVSDIKSFMPSGAKKNSTYSYGEEDSSEDGITYIYYDEVYTKDGMAYNVFVDYYEDDEYGIDATASICVLKESQLAAYAEYFDSEGDDDWDDDDDWEDDDDDDEGGGGGTVIEGAIVIDFAVESDVSGSVSGVKYQAELGSNPNKTPPAHNAAKSELRLYIGNTLTLSGASFTTIEFDANSCGETKADGTLSCSTGKMNGFTWTGNASSVTFTVADGKQVHINSISIA